MKKLLFASLLSTLLCINNFKAQDICFDKGTVVATAGYGFPDLYRANIKVAYNDFHSRVVTGFGPLILKGDYGIVKLKWGHSVGAGIVLGYSSTQVDFSDNHYSTMDFQGVDYYRTITIGARGSYHFFTKEKIDCYASIGLGYNINSYTRTVNNKMAPFNSNLVSRSVLYESFTVGIRYYFTKNIGVYSELGWDMSTPIQGGIALKF